MALMLDSLPTVSAYSCFAGSYDSDIQLGGPLRPRMICGLPNIGGGGREGFLRAGLLKEKLSVSSALQLREEMTYFALSVGPSVRRAKLLGKRGFPGPRSPSAS